MPSLFDLGSVYSEMQETLAKAFSKPYTEKVKAKFKMKQYVVHCKREKYDVYIGRPSKWGNPYQIGRDGTREEVLAKYEHWLLSTPMGKKTFKDIHELKGKVLGCFCAPNACHGDILRKYLKEM